MVCYSTALQSDCSGAFVTPSAVDFIAPTGGYIIGLLCSPLSQAKESVDMDSSAVVSNKKGGCRKNINACGVMPGSVGVSALPLSWLSAEKETPFARKMNRFSVFGYEQ